ncbi:TldD/PmbA family protein [Alicyclobacillus ferrooxydans]|uniref:TldD/PmbA family protein n=1 Tax=Alicyclobacillus ferrooxydans TaxID=471514 RepID=UPI0006D5B0B8|nr:TldD/PmbA family protein [Alicyclobacillus ferrooxydans]
MDLKSFQDQVFVAGAEAGFTEMEVYHERQSSFTCSVYQGQVDGYESADVTGVSFRGVYQGKMGYAFTERIAPDSVGYLIASARDNASIIGDEDEDDIFPGGGQYQEADFYARDLDSVSIEAQIELIKEIEAHARSLDSRVRDINYCAISSLSMERGICNNAGLDQSDARNNITVYLSVVVAEGGETRTGSAIRVTQDFATLKPTEIAAEAVGDALSYLGARQVANKAYPVILKNDAAAALLQTFAPVFSAENVQKGMSQLKGKVGTAVGVPGLNIVDDPFLPGGMNSRTFDAEGYPAARRDIVKDGELQTLLYNRKAARKDGVKSTGHAFKSSYKDAVGIAPSNLYIQPAGLAGAAAGQAAGAGAAGAGAGQGGEVEARQAAVAGQGGEVEARQAAVAGQGGVTGVVGQAGLSSLENRPEPPYAPLLAGIDEGIVITGLSGLHSGANSVSGDFSLAATGFYVENGAVQSPVNQMTVAGNFFEVLSSIVVIGDDLDFTVPFLGAPGYVGSPSLLIKGLSITVD